MIKKIKYLFIFFIFMSLVGGAQNQNKKWYFGSQAGLDFMTSPPTIITTGVMNTSEGCASVADAAGNLLFYTDGSTVYNTSNVAMANGTGLLGFSSSSQSAIIVKQPGNATIYYVFTQGASPNGTRYSLVDMSLAAGMGSVTAKNVLVFAPSSEKLTSVKHCNGTDIWVLTHDYTSNTFRNFLVTSAGISNLSTPVISNIGVSYAGGDYIGILKTSPNGKKLVQGLYGTTSGYELYDFDNSTGLVSNPLLLAGSFFGAYGTEFSPDGTKLYGTRYGNTAVYQWDLCAGSNTAIAASQVTLTIAGNSKGALQLGPDGKIYIAKGGQTALAVINNPNLAGIACNYVEVGQSIAPKTSQWGLPNFITSGFLPPPAPYTYTANNNLGCQTASFTPPAFVQNYSVAACVASGYSVTGVQWLFGDAASGAANTSTLQNPAHAYTQLGTYTTKLVVYYSCGGGTDTITQQVIINQPCISVTSQSITCASLGSATVVATGGVGPYSYTWMPTAQTSSVASNLNPGTYTITVFDSGNNFTYSATTVFTSLVPFTGVVAATQSLLCNGANTGTANIPLSGGSGSQNYYWTSPTGTQTTIAASGLGAGIHTITVIDALTSCSLTQFFQITEPPAFTLNITASSPTACAGTSISFTAVNSGGTPFASGAAYTYSWSGGPATDTYIVSQATSGNYTYTVSSKDAYNCGTSTVIPVSFVNNPVLGLASVSICPLQTGVLNASGASTFTWSNGTNGSTLSDNPAVTTAYSFTGAALGCTASASASIILKPIPTPTLSSNSPICNGQQLQLNGSGGSSYLWTGPLSFNSAIQNPQISPAAPGNSGVYNATVTAANSCTAPASISVTVNPTPTLSAAGSTVCVSQTMSLTANSIAGASYAWTGPNAYTAAVQNPTVNSPAVTASGLYTVLATSAAGCTNSAVVNVTVTALPVPSFITDSPKCQGSTINFNSAASTGAGAYAWSGPNGFSSTLPNPSLNNAPVAGNGNYTLQITTGPCVATAVNAVTIYPLPAPLASNNSPVCETKSLALTVNLGNVTYTWSGPGGYSSSMQNPVINNATASQNGSYSVAVTDSNTCQFSSVTTVTVMSNPVLSTAGAKVCYGQPATITASGAVSYNWTGPGGYSSSQAQAIIPAAINTQLFTYTVTGQGVNTCTSVATAIVETMVLPIASATITPRACVNSPVFFQGNGGLSYAWTGPLSFKRSVQNFSATVVNSGMGGTYTLMVTDSAGCNGFATAPLIVDPSPSGNIASSPGNNCVPFCADFKLYNSGTSPIASSSWQIGGQTYTANVLNYCFTTAGDYLLRGSFTDANGCSGEMFYMINAHPKPQAAFNYAPQQANENDEVLFTNTSVGDKQLSWDWTFGTGDGYTTNTTQLSYIFKESGSYPVALVVKNTWGCADTVVQAISIGEDFSLYVPEAFTPNGDNLNDIFMAKGRGIKEYSLMVFDRWGELIFVTYSAADGWNGSFKGQGCKQDVYSWKITATGMNGQEKKLTGMVLLYR